MYDLSKISSKYRKTLSQELLIRPSGLNLITKRESYTLESPKEIHRLVWQIFEITKSSFVPRSYTKVYGLSARDEVFESVGGHTNLVYTITCAALDFYYGCRFGEGTVITTMDGYSLREVMEAIRLHDLAENEYGDSPDNGARDEVKKLSQETAYFKQFLEASAKSDKEASPRVLRLLQSMQSYDSETGRLLYLADKTAALIVTLFLDSIGKPPMLSRDSPYASERDLKEMLICSTSTNLKYHASEMWAIDFFEVRHLCRLDHNFFFTAIIIMATLMVHGEWYYWRKKRYLVS